jgi:pimeloyl-ACP methyl ester carboxylesterase
MRRIRIGDRSLRLRDEGEGTRAPLVCIHGAGASSVVWMDTVRRLSPSRRVIAPDLPGHGQSDRWRPVVSDPTLPSSVSASEITVERYRDAVGAICESLALERVVLVGHSLGALIALSYAVAFPERVAGLVLVAGAAKLTVMPRVFEVLERDWANAPTWLAHMSFSPSTPRDLVERWAQLQFTAEREIAVADFRAADRFDARPLLPSVTAPVLVVGGADDLLTPPALTHELAAALPNARAVVLARAGHSLILEQPVGFQGHVRELLLTVP